MSTTIPPRTAPKGRRYGSSANGSTTPQAVQLRPMPSWRELAGQPIETNLYHIGAGFLEVGCFMLLVGASYAGKSTFLAQFSMYMACGKDWLFFHFQRPLRVLTIQAEDPINKRRRMGKISDRAGFTPHELALIDKNTGVLSISDKQDADFFKELIPHIEAFKPDVIIINPLTSFICKGVYNDEPINTFLRVNLAPLLAKYNISAIVAHHPPKPKAKEIDDLTAFEVQYAGSGMASLTNATRATLLIAHIDGDVFRLAAGKGYEELDSIDTEAYLKRDKDASGRMLWVECSGDEVTKATNARRTRKASADRKTTYSAADLGRPKKWTVDQLIAVLGNLNLKTKAFQRRANEEIGMPKTSFYELITEAQKDGKLIKSSTDETWEIVR